MINYSDRKKEGNSQKSNKRKKQPPIEVNVAQRVPRSLLQLHAQWPRTMSAVCIEKNIGKNGLNAHKFDSINDIEIAEQNRFQHEYCIILKHLNS